MTASSAAPLRWREFRSRVGRHALLLEGSQVVDVPPTAELSDELLAEFLAHGESLGLDQIPDVPVQAVSLNLTSACNLACSYCYADQGSFGGAQEGSMSLDGARQVVQALLAGCDRRARATIGFLGGEPFLRRDLLWAIVAEATALAAAVGQPIGFSATTNGTRIDGIDIERLRRHPFTLTVSIDGAPGTHDRRRLTLAGQGTWHDIVDRVQPLLAEPGSCRVTARATVTRDGLDLAAGHDALRAAGFDSIGFSPVRQGFGALGDGDWARWSAASIELGERSLAELIAGRPVTFENFGGALRRLHAGASSPYPCGAGGGYVTAATDGSYHACHRAIGDERFALGGASPDGPDPTRRAAFVAAHHVSRKEPCSSCWARYLCGGGCHQEQPVRTDAACDALRAWLEFCLDAYCAATTARPDWFTLAPEADDAR